MPNRAEPTYKCTVQNCERAAVRRDWCDMHYRRWMKYGDPLQLYRQPVGSSWMNKGYVILPMPNRSCQAEHRFLAEKALGKSLPPGALVHHMNKNKSDNHTPWNLIVCPDEAYHQLLHRRMEEYDAKLGRPSK